MTNFIKLSKLYTTVSYIMLDYNSCLRIGLGHKAQKTLKKYFYKQNSKNDLKIKIFSEKC